MYLVAGISVSDMRNINQDNEKVGERVQRLRELKRKSRAQLGGSSDLSERSIARIEAGVAPLPTEDRERIAKALGVTPEYLRNGDSHAERETKRWIEENRNRLNVTPDEENRLKEAATHMIRQRKQARNPLSPEDVESLLIILRGQ